MNQRHLEYFLEVLKYKSIKRAADVINISPQGISKTVIELETELGTELFHREGKKLMPTKKAYQFVSHARKILEEYSAIQQIASTDIVEKKVLRVLTEPDVPQYLTVEFIKDFIEAHPDILLNMIEVPHTLALRQLRESEAEFGILGGPIDTTEFSITYLYSNRFCAVIHKDNPLAAYPVIKPEHLHGQRVAMRGRDFSLYNVHLNKIMEQGVAFTEVLETSSYHIIHRMAQKNLSIGFSFDYIAFPDMLPDTVIRPFDIEEPKAFFVVEPLEGMLSPEAAVFKQFLLNWISNHEELLAGWKNR